MRLFIGGIAPQVPRAHLIDPIAKGCFMNCLTPFNRRLSLAIGMLIVVCFGEPTAECGEAGEQQERTVPTAKSALLEQQRLKSGHAGQGLALAEKFYFGATATTLYRFDTKWQLIDFREITIEGVNHMGAIDYHKPFIWAGFLNHGKTDGEYDPSLNRSIIAKIDAEKLEVLQTWDITEDCKWIDPVSFDGKYLWVGEMNNLGIHRYRLEGDELVRAGVLRYPEAMSFSQGLRVRENRIYSIHTFGSMDGLFEFEIPERLTEEVVQPVQVWPVQETVMHLEGFDFIPGTKNEIWHAQSSQVDRYRLQSLNLSTTR